MLLEYKGYPNKSDLFDLITHDSAVIHLPARSAGLARKNRRWRKILKDVHPFGASFCRLARLRSVFYHTKVRLVTILL